MIDQLNSEICSIMFNIAKEMLNKDGMQFSSEDEYVENFLGVTPEELKVIVKFVLEDLPTRIYLDSSENVRDYAVVLISKDLVMFLVQENKESDEFKNNLVNFRQEITNEILTKVTVVN